MGGERAICWDIVEEHHASGFPPHAVRPPAPSLAALAAAFVYLAVPSTSLAAPAGGPPGGAMSVATVTRIGSKRPGIRERTLVYRERLDPVPIVLWGADGPAAILSLRVRTNHLTRGATVEILRADGEKGPGAFPIET